MHSESDKEMKVPKWPHGLSSPGWSMLSGLHLEARFNHNNLFLKAGLPCVVEILAF